MASPEHPTPESNPTAISDTSPPQQSTHPPVATQIGYFFFFYLLLATFLALSFSFSQEFLKPVMALIFPINPTNSLPKMLLIFSAFYWVVALFLMISNRKAHH